MAALILCLAIQSLLFEFSSLDLTIPLVYGDDALLTHALAKTLVERPWCSTNPALGAPGVMELYDFPMADGLHFLWLKALSVLGADWPTAVNLYFLLTFPLTTLSSLGAMRRLGLPSAPAVVCSLLFAFLPYHLIRNQAHLLLAGYYVVPLSVLAAVWIAWGALPATGQMPTPERPWLRRLALATICLLQASAGIYFAAFACFLLLVAGISGCVERRQIRPLAIAGLLILATSAGVIANVAPTIVYWSKHGRNSDVAQRPVAHAEFFGLKLAQLLLPVEGHRITPLARLRDRYNKSSLTPNENGSVTLGAVGAAGFLALLWIALFGRRRRGPRDLLDLLSKFNLAAVLLATTGGFGVMFNLLVDPSIRCYNRMGVFLGFFSLAAIAQLMAPCAAGCGLARGRQALGGMLLAAVLVLGILDQAPPAVVPAPNWIVPDRAVMIEQFRSDAEFVARLEAATPAGAMIYQTPYVSFPESIPFQRLGPYDQLRPYLHSTKLRWSFGCMRGRAADHWQQAIFLLPMAQRLVAIKEAGFSGILVHRRAFADDGRQIESELTELFGEASVESRNRELVYFSFNDASSLPAPAAPVASALQ